MYERKEGLHYCKYLAKEFGKFCANLGPALVIAEREYSPASLAIRPFKGKLSAPSNTSHTQVQPIRTLHANLVSQPEVSKRNRSANHGEIVRRVLQISLATAMLVRK
jgi:hypothetical protein